MIPQMQSGDDKRIIDNSGAVIVCSHIAVEGRAILRAIRSKSLSAEDSGWQFLCNVVEKEDEKQARVWSIREVLELDLSLKSFLNMPVGTTLLKNDQQGIWEAILSN